MDVDLRARAQELGSGSKGKKSDTARERPAQTASRPASFHKAAQLSPDGCAALRRTRPFVRHYE